MEYEYNDESLNRHQVSRSEVDEILAASNITTRDFDMPLSLVENLRIMFVGFTFAGRLLEVGVELKSEEKARVFHAQAISPKFRKMYEERIGNE